MSLSAQFSQFIGLTSVNITQLETNRNFCIKNPTGMSLEDNINYGEVTSRDKKGRETIINRIQKSYNPTLDLSFSGANFQLVALSNNREIENVSSLLLNLPYQVIVSSPTLPPITNPKYPGYGIAEDVPVAASTVDSLGISIPLTQQNFDTFSPTIQNSFAVGQNLALKFSNDLVESKSVVTLEINQLLSGYTVSKDLGMLRLSLLAINSLQRLAVIFIPYAQIISSGKWDFSGENISIRFSLIVPPGKCEAYEIIQTDLIQEC